MLMRLGDAWRDWNRGFNAGIRFARTVNRNKPFWTRDREAGNFIDEFATVMEARNAIRKYEQQDRRDGYYEPNFYEIYDAINGKIVH